MIVDTRESALVECLKNTIATHSQFAQITFEVKSLDLGDISMDEWGLVFERKTLSDLQASIRDGRYKEQGYRLSNSTYHPHNIIYILEGSFTDYKYKGCDKQSLFSAMTSLQYFKGFSVMRTMNLAETVFFLCNTICKIKKENKPSFFGRMPEVAATTTATTTATTETTATTTDPTTEQVETEKHYAKYVNKVKGKNVTENNIHEIMLMQIPGISDISAKHIIKEFKSIPTMVEKIKENPKVITEFQYVCEKTNKPKRLSKAIAANIIKFLI
jgi:ERCC4-type nuclease